MKKFIVLITAILVLVSCTVQPSAKMGSLTLAVDTSARSEGSVGVPTTIRYSLKRNGTVIPLNNRPSVEATISGATTITIDDLLPGKGYQLTLSIGTKIDQYLDVAYYGTSSVFGISEGTDTVVPMTLNKGIAYVPLATSGGVSSAAVVGTTLYVLDGSVLTSYSLPLATVPNGTEITPLPSVTINSLSVGQFFPLVGGVAKELWLNTSGGIWGKNVGNSFINISGGLTPNVLFSRTVAIDPNAIVGIYSGGGTNLGMVVASVQTDFTTTGWKTLDSLNSTLKDFLSAITGDIITGVSVNKENNIFYVSTPLGTFIGSKELSEIIDVKAYTLKAPGDISIRVVSTAANLVFAGTDSGVYSGTINVNSEDTTKKLGEPLNGLTLISGTAGKKIVFLESYNNEGTVITAAITADNTVFLINGGEVFQTLYDASGIPEKAKAVFYGTDTVHVILTGTDGAIDYDTGESTPN